ncbi:MAG: DUF7472 family protein [Haloferacaceae archaeon]
MELDAEARRQIVLAVGAVGSFIVLIIAIGAAFPGEAFATTGAFALIGAIAVFVLVMGLVGIYLARKGGE